MKSLLAALASALLATACFGASAQAQPGVGQGVGQGVDQEARTDDVDWETRREPWNHASVRPGGQLEGETSGWVWLGTSVLIGGYALSFTGLDPRTGSIIPLVGPWLSAAGAFDEGPWADGQTAAMIASGVLQAGGILAIILGALHPRYYVIYDAPVGSPQLYVTWSPGLNGADVGTTVSVDFL